MSSNRLVDRETIQAALAALEAARAEVAGLSFDALTDPEVLAVLEQLETQRRSQPSVEHRLINRLGEQGCPAELGAPTLVGVLSTRLQISRAEARRRIAEANDLGPRTAITGEVLEPRLPHTAAAQAQGRIGAEHVQIIRGFFTALPEAIDIGTRCAAEADLAAIGAEFDPAGLRQGADRLMALLHPDGDFTDTDRARRRGVVIGRQGSDGMSPIKGLLDPEARATLDAVLAKWAAPGMGNPDDPSPCVDGDPDEAAKASDTRTPAQRNHDALKVIGRAVLASGQLGSHNGLPCTVIVSTTLTELESGAGHAVTGGGTLLPMSDVIRLASHSYHCLTIFDDHTGRPLYLGRTKRLASADQRIVLHAKDRGCTFPGCTAPGYQCQVHHITDWAQGGLTNIDNETLACGPHNRLVKPGGWTTRKHPDGATEWIPPPHLDTGQTRVNHYHHPERLLGKHDDVGQPSPICGEQPAAD